MKKASTGPADRSTPGPPAWYETLFVRLAAVLAAMLLGFDLLVRPALNFVLARIGLRPPGGGGLRALDLAVSTVVAALIAALVAFLVARWLTARLARLSDWAVDAARSDDLSAAFDDPGHDEIAIAGAAMSKLCDRVAERIKGLALKDLRRREWIAQVSHDLRTPLTAQLACLDRADAALEKPDSPQRRKELQELLAVAKMDADRVHTLADDLLEIARLDAGDSLRLEPVPPGELVRQAVRRLEPLASQKGIRIEVRVTSRLPVLNADGRRLTRAIENLMRNAIQHARSSVEVIAARADRCVRFEVRDDGRGLPKQPDFLDYLRRKSSTVRLSELAKRRGRSDSAGLGLIVAQRVAEAHEGVVDAYNLSSGGAAFWLDIPIPTEAFGAEAEAEAVS